MKPETIIAICSIIIALSALGISFWQGYTQQRHHKLSVTPQLTIEFDLRDWTDIGIYLKSTGLGPAKLKEYKWIVNDKEFLIRTKQDYLDIIKKLGIIPMNDKIEFYGLGIDEYIETGFETFLIRFPNSANSKTYKEIATKLCTSKIQLTFESIYGDSYSKTYESSYA